LGNLLAKGFPYVINPKIPLFGKEGRGRFYESYMETFVLKIPLHPPLPKGE
jgi:hypothetical protein